MLANLLGETVIWHSLPPCLSLPSVANLLGETIWRVYNSASVQALRD